MLIGGILLGLLAGLVLGGKIGHLADIRLRLLPLLFVAVVVRFGTEIALSAGIELFDLLRLPAFAIAYGLLLYGLWANRSYPGLGLAFVGVGMNAIAIVANGGWMPVWAPSLTAAGFDPAVVTAESVFHQVLGPELDLRFFLSGGPIGDIIPIPGPIDAVRNVASIGDLFLTAGLAFFLFATLLRSPADDTRQALEDAAFAGGVGLAGTARLPHGAPGRTADGIAIRPGTGLGGLRDQAQLERASMGGGTAMGSLSPAFGPLPLADATAGVAAGVAATPTAAGPAGAIPLPRPIAVRRRSLLSRARRHPWVRLALNGSFSALWAGQLISQFGDRVHQVALFALVYTITGSALATALAFFAATLPNLLLSPIAGAYVDRWNTKQVLVVSDILRAAVVLLIPVAVLVNVAFAYPLVFAMTAITIFFRPAKTAMLPRIVRDEDLLPANSALWVGETLADVVGYPLAGLFVAFLAASLPLAFWFDAATYLASAVLLASIAVPKLRRSRAEDGAPAEGTTEAGTPGRSGDETGEESAGQPGGEGDGGDEPLPTGTSILEDLKVGWRFLRNEPVLLANTLQGAVGQFAIGVIGAVAYVYADRVLSGAIDPDAAFSFLETAIGVGNLAGGLALGLLAVRLSKGGLVIAGYLLFGACVVLLGLVSALPLAVGLMVGAGIANMIYVIPSQTLFQERTPDALIGRVVGLRFALVFGSMAIAAPIAGVVTDLFGPGPAIAFAGLLSLGAGAAGFFTKAVREA